MPTTDRVSIDHLSTPRAVRETLAEDVTRGLAETPKNVPSKYFYDARGSELFERITRLEEYYPTRTETAILEAHAGSIVDDVRPDELLELGSGSSRKTRLLLEAMHEHGTGDRYVPIDVSEDALRAAAETLSADYPWLEVRGIVGDFHDDLAHVPRRGTRLVAFLGSTIGNLDAPARHVLLSDVARMLEPGDRFLLGADLVKDVDELIAAYDDAEGVTAEFNRNVLHVINRELDADFPVDRFRHTVVWDADEEAIRSSLTADDDVTVTFRALDLRVTFAAGEQLHTEMSAKFRRRTLEPELAAAGLRVDRWLTDPEDRFAVVVAELA